MSTRSRLARIFHRLKGPGDDERRVDPTGVLEGRNLEALRSLIELIIERRGGPLAAQRRAATLAEVYLALAPDSRGRFFSVLAEEYGAEHALVDEAAEALRSAVSPEGRLGAERVLRERLISPREHLFRAFVGIDSGLAFLMQLREDLLALRESDLRIRQVEAELRDLLSPWFHVGLLTLNRITWDSSAALLEKLIEYEAVHEIASWDDLRNRLGPDRRCYALQHPALPDDLLIFVEVAFTNGLAASIIDLIDPHADDPDLSKVDTAIFYSISNCQDGLRGVSLGEFLIKRVVQELTAELPHLKVFATLSPMPGFRAWLTGLPDRAGVVAGLTENIRSIDDPTIAVADIDAVLADERWYDDVGLVERIEPVLHRLAARYLVHERRGRNAADPVARFHLSNGARVERLQFLANPGPTGQERALGMMVNYRYELDEIEANYDSYVAGRDVAHSGEIAKLL